MQKYIYISVLSFMICSCGKSDDSTPPVEVNVAPTVPELVFPTNNLLCTDSTLDFEWSPASDVNGGVLTYDIEIAKDNQFSEIIHSANSKTTTQNITLEKGFAYYWRVKAIDAQKASSDYSATFNFYTELEGLSNHLPFAPELIMPELDDVAQAGEVLLEWEANDIDEDIVTYDVYFGSENPPTTVVSENQTATTFEVTISENTDFYWKIIVKDDKGGQTIGQVWTFSTN